MPKYGMVIDLDKCFGCRACMVACKVENNTPEKHFWMYVFRLEEGEYPNSRVSFLPRPCMHCENAPCVKVCPVKARYHEEGGFVATDWDRCIGCRYCAVACPYGVNNFNWTKPEESQYLNWDDPDLVPLLNELAPQQGLEINPKTAKDRGIKDGSEVWVESHNAVTDKTRKRKTRARYLESIRPDTVCLPHHYGFWVNPITEDQGPTTNTLFYSGEGYVSNTADQSFHVKVKVYKA